jgi:hypothetical protein
MRSAFTPHHFVIRHSMSRIVTTLALAGALALGATAQAQQAPRPMGPPMGGAPNGIMMDGPGMGPGGGAASMLLAHTGDFKLSDAQVTRLAAIARRTSDRQRAMRASMDSMRSNVSAPAAPAPGGEVRMGPTPAMRAMAERMREQEHADLRDAIAVLTPDQQAQGWEMMARQGARGGMGAGGAPMVRRQMMQRGGPRRGAAGAQPAPPAGDRGGPPPGRAIRTRPPVNSEAPAPTR